MGEIMAAAKPIPGIDISIVAIRRGHNRLFQKAPIFAVKRCR
jgi:hypothetical protein